VSATTSRAGAATERPLVSVDPATGETFEEHHEHDHGELTLRLDLATEAARKWADTPVENRVAVLRAAARLLRERAGDHAAVMAREMGKPLPQGRAESEKCAAVCDWFADHAVAMLRPRDVPPAPGADGGPLHEQVVFAPIGPVLAIMPWNFPFWQAFRFAAPAVAAGNVVLLKHAESVQGCARAIEELLRSAEAPAGVLQNLAIGVSRVGDVIRHPAVTAVTFTGSVRGGRAVAEAAGGAVKKTVLELGGSDPYVVLADADLEHAARTCVTARLVNGGQTCVAAKRFVVVDTVRAEFTRRVVEEMRSRTVGDPRSEPPPDLGPLARGDLRDALHAQVEGSVARGARKLVGGEIPSGPGFFYPPTVLADVREGMPAYHEETFGPVAAILPARDEDDAIRIANDTSFGLGAAVFTRDLERGERIARERLQAGFCAVNDFVRSDPRLPFGGIKESGWGRELSEFGLREFVNVKTVVVGAPRG